MELHAAGFDRAAVADCPLRALARAIGGKWKIAILGHLLAAGPLRTAELRRAVGGVSEKVLVDQLRALERDGLVVRTDHHEVPPRVDYRLSPLGAALSQQLAPLAAWSAEHLVRSTPRGRAR